MYGICRLSSNDEDSVVYKVDKYREAHMTPRPVTKYGCNQNNGLHHIVLTMERQLLIGSM
ncbi:hypothetical protein BLOT_005139 [Blomia tropicalis]|nr:hypothetical protein BLOT_005139 [Blomia tropicalis]